MSGNSVHPATKYRVLPDPGLRAQRPDSYIVLGVLLDQRGRVTGTRLYRPADCSDDDDDERRRSSHTTAGLLHQSHRRLDDRLSRSLSVFFPCLCVLLRQLKSLSVGNLHHASLCSSHSFHLPYSG